MNTKNRYLFKTDVEKIEECFELPTQIIYDNEEASKKINEVIRSCFSERELEICDKFFNNGKKTIDFAFMDIDGEFKVIEPPKFSCNLIHIGGSLPFPSKEFKRDKKKRIIDKLNKYIESNPNNPITKCVNLIFLDMNRNSLYSTLRDIEFLNDIPSVYHKYINKTILEELEERDAMFYSKFLNLFGNDIEVPKFKKDRLISDSDMLNLIEVFSYTIMDKFDKIEPSKKEIKEWIENNVNKIYTVEEKQILTNLDLGEKQLTAFYVKEGKFSTNSKGSSIIAYTFDLYSHKYTLGIRISSPYVVEKLNEMDLSYICEYEKRCKKWREDKKFIQKNINVIRVMNDTNTMTEDFKKILKVMYDSLRPVEEMNDSEHLFKRFYDELVEI